VGSEGGARFCHEKSGIWNGAAPDPYRGAVIARDDGLPDDDRLLAELRAAAAPLRDDRTSARERGLALSIPGFTLLRELRRGGQGVVYVARQHEPPRDVALKLLHGRGRARAPARVRFEREAALAARLHHPHVVTIHASGCAGDVPWYAMELVDGVPLDAWLAAHAPPRRARLELFVKIARAVAHAHQRGVLHRDLKPDNVLVDADGAPHVLDFGIARALDPDVAAGVVETHDGEFLGTLAYAAPEQLAGGAAVADTRSDVHALGALLFEMVTGALPYDVSGGLAAVVERVAHASPRRPRDVDPSVDDELALVIATALAKDPERRYATAEALAADVERWLRCEPLAARGASPWYVLQKALARRRRSVAALAVTLLLGAAGAAVFVRQRLASDRAARAATDVRAVLLDLLEAARPDRMGGSVPLPELLEEAARRLDGRLDTVPDVRAELLLAIGETYLKLQRPDDAAPHLRTAVELARRAGDPLALARSLHALGCALADHDEAGALLEEALALRARVLGETSGPAAESRSALARDLADRFHAPDPARGEALQREALAQLVAAYGEAHPAVARARVWLAQSCARRGRAGAAAADAEAEALFKQADADADPGADPAADPAVGVASLHAHALFLQMRARFDEAQALLERALGVTRARFGEEQQPELLRAFARLHFARGDFASSERVSRQALGDELARWGRRRPELDARAAPLVAALRDATQAAPWRDAFALLREVRGAGSYETAGWMVGIALLLQKQGRPEVAAPLLRDSLEIHCRILGDECPTRRRALALLADFAGLEAGGAR
jgi:serine/threonine-protein kinase